MKNGTSRSGTKHLIFGLIAGGTIGAALALLYAPDKGSKLRASLRKKSGKLADDTRKSLDDAAHKVTDSLNDAKRSGERVLNDTVKKVETVAEKAARALK